ncbi:DUF1016 N-terminal domain-containing protein [Pedobacter chinensis]|uniref:DUF1016 N-terminal domain-containing protein n=1 Tax=Pedobacter chinensis TaxID=2282421 RepID=UPI0018F3976C|nr:DUF1016 N-terminal domain-containing protein [Pedobacter chinensis]
MVQKNIEDTGFIRDIKTLIEQSKQQISVAVNTAITTLYWSIGKKINEEILKDKRAEYGKCVVVSLAKQLEIEYGSGWSEKQLRHCLRFAEIMPEKEIVYTLCRQLSWSHIRILILWKIH